MPVLHRAAELVFPPTGLHRKSASLFPPAPPASVDSAAETQAFGVVRTGIGDCTPCGRVTAGVITRNGFRCDNYTSHPAGGAG